MFYNNFIRSNITRSAPKPITRNLGNILIILGLAGLIFTYYPLIGIFFDQPKFVKADSVPSKLSLTIPKINAYAPIILNVDPWHEANYQQALQYGVAHAKGTSTPGNEGTIFLFAHSSDYPWRLTKYNTVFLRLGELTTGDKIKIEDQGIKYNYEVFDKKVVWPNEVSYLKSKTNQLIIQTCTPLGTDLQRLLIFAKQV